MLAKPVSQNPELDLQDNVKITPPGFGKSVFDGFIQTTIAPFAGMDAISNLFQKEPSPTWAIDFYQQLQKSRDTEGSSGVGNFIGDALGFAINPINIVGGGVGSLVGGSVAKGAARFAPKVAMKIAPSLKFGGAFAGSMVPNDVIANYNEDENRLDLMGFTTSQTINAGIGMALPAIPFTFGLLKGKISQFKAAKNRNAELKRALDEGSITAEEHAFMSAHFNGENAETLTPLAKDIMKKSGVEADPVSGHVNIDLLKPKDINNLHNMMADQVASDLAPELKTALSDFVAHGRLDDIISNPKLVDGLRGYAEHMGERILKKPERLAKLDKILDEHMTKGLTADAELSQKAIYKAIKSGEDLRGYAIPKHVEDLLTHEAKIISASEELKSAFARLSEIESRDIGEGTSASAVKLRDRVSTLSQELEQLKLEKPGLLHPSDELHYLRQVLTKEDTQRILNLDRDYNRLRDLMDRWHGAKILHERIEHAGAYDKQAALSDIAAKIVQIADANLGKLQNEGNVVDYLKNRIEKKIKKVSDTPIRETPQLSEPDIKTTIEALPEGEQKEIAKSFLNKAAELSEKESVLTDFVSCILKRSV